MGSGLLAFGLVALALVVTPGPDFAVVVPNALERRSTGVSTAIGTATGLAVHAAIAAAGLSALVLTSDTVFTVVKLSGAVFLVILGARAILQSRRHRSPRASAPTGDRRRLSNRRAYRQGLLVNVMNPKAPVIYLSVMPQFLQPGAPDTPQLIAMSAILVGLALTWYVTLSLLVFRVRTVVERFRTVMDRVTGGILIALGVRVAFESRPV